MKTPVWILSPFAATLLAFAGAQAAEPQSDEVAPVVVVGITPVGGDLEAGKIAAPVQTGDSQAIDRSHALDLSAFMTRTFSGVYANDIQNNPLQPDINYRGFTASPLLGTPQGLSVYVDGMRFNQPFGDVVSWDLIPRQAIDRVALIPGSNPLFGLNTLGGALAINTKDGRKHPGGMIQLSYGSYGRKLAEAEAGGVSGALDYYITASRFEDDGWRDHSPSEATQGFAKVGWTGDETRLVLSAAYADTDLNGNGLQEQRFLERDRASVYTHPDNTRNKSRLANLRFERDFSSGVDVSGNAYYRKIDSSTYNGDINDESLTEAVYQPSAAERAALTSAGYTGFPTAGETAANTPFPKWRCIANILTNEEPNEKCNGLINTTSTDQQEAGLSAEAKYRSAFGGYGNLFIVGGAYRQSEADFTQATRFGYLTPERGVATVDGPGAIADGTQNSEDAFDSRVDLNGRTRTWSLFVADVLDFSPAVSVTASGRYDVEKVRNRDAITPGGGPGSLDGDHRFERFNPAIGMTWKATDTFTAYASLTQGGRAPSVIELGCADPDNPCRLPNALAGDPPLKQVRTLTEEIGARGNLGFLEWNVGIFRADNRDDILFVADDVSGFGYFKNFGRTRREGVELGIEGRRGPMSFGASYTYLDATYETAETVGGAGNSSNDGGPGFEGDIDIAPGNRIPLIPEAIFKAQMAWDVTNTLSLTADLQAASGVYARGDENNQHQPDGLFYLGRGETDGYAVVNLGADWRALPRVNVFAQVTNLFDTKYETAAQLGATGFTDDGAFIARPFSGPVIDGERPTRNATFYAPGAPRMIQAGIRYEFGRGG